MALVPPRRLLWPASLTVLVLAALSLASRWRSGQAAGAAPPSARVPWQTARGGGSPDPPPPYTAARAFPNASFHHPLLFVRAPETDRLFIGEQEGKLYSLAHRPDAKPELALDLRRDLKRHPF